MIWGGSPAHILKAAEEGIITVVVSEDIVEEVNRALAYHKLREILQEAGVSREELVETVLRIGKIVEVETRLNVIKDDRSDNKFLECAAESNADYIVSGDEHLLKIKSYKKSKIISARQFVRLLEELVAKNERC